MASLAVVINSNSSLISAISNLVCPLCGASMMGFRCLGYCGSDRRQEWERAIRARSKRGRTRSGDRTQSIECNKQLAPAGRDERQRGEHQCGEQNGPLCSISQATLSWFSISPSVLYHPRFCRSGGCFSNLHFQTLPSLNRRIRILYCAVRRNEREVSMNSTIFYGLSQTIAPMRTRRRLNH